MVIKIILLCGRIYRGIYNVMSFISQQLQNLYVEGLSPEAQAMCDVLVEMERQIAALKTRLHRIETKGHDE